MVNLLGRSAMVSFSILRHFFQLLSVERFEWFGEQKGADFSPIIISPLSKVISREHIFFCTPSLRAEIMYYSFDPILYIFLLTVLVYHMCLVNYTED